MFLMITWRKPNCANDEVDGCYPIRDLLDIYPNPSGLNAPIEHSEMKSWIHVDEDKNTHPYKNIKMGPIYMWRKNNLHVVC